MKVEIDESANIKYSFTGKGDMSFDLNNYHIHKTIVIIKIRDHNEARNPKKNNITSPIMICFQ